MMIQTGRLVISSDDMAQGFFAPLVAAYIAWNDRQVLTKPTSTGNYWSLVFVLAGAVIGLAATLANSTTFARFGFQFSMAGCFLSLGGWVALKRLLFPLALLFFSFPVPDVLYAQVTQPLQLLATSLAEGAFELMGYSVYREGNILQLTHMRLSVVEACSGLRSLMALFFFCIVYAYFFETRRWRRILIAAASIPSAIIVNVLRITSTGVLGQHHPEWTEGTRHEIVGWIAVTVGFLAVLLLHRQFPSRDQRLQACPS
jgi:exosortase